MPNSSPSPQSAAPSPNLSRAQQLVLDLMAIPGKSGEEEQVAQFIRQKLLAAGARQEDIKTDNSHKFTLLKGNTGNLILKLPGTLKKAPRRMLSAHMDTVPICVGCEPVVKGEFARSANPATGLGGDDRAGAATILTAALEILERGLPHPPLTFCWFIQEEIGLQGARHLQLSLLGKPAVAFNWDGGSPDKMTIGATGGYRMNVEVQGIASHAGVAPERASAIAVASIAIAELHRGGWHGLVQKGKSSGTSNVGFISAGEATNVVTDRATLKVEARSHDPKFRQKLVGEIEKAFKNAAKEVKSIEGKTGSARFEGRLDYESFRIDPNHPCVQLAEAAVLAVGRKPLRAISNGGLDANWLNAHGIPTVTLGCGQMNVHMTSEMLDLAGFRDACRIALRLATGS